MKGVDNIEKNILRKLAMKGGDADR